MQVVVGETRGESSVGARSMPADRSATDALPEPTVEELDAVRAMSRAGDRIVHAVIGAANGGVCVVCGVPSSARRQADARRTAAPPREELHHARHRIGAVQNTRGPTHDLDALEIFGAE